MLAVELPEGLVHLLLCKSLRVQASRQPLAVLLLRSCKAKIGCGESKRLISMIRSSAFIIDLCGESCPVAVIPVRCVLEASGIGSENQWDAMRKPVESASEASGLTQPSQSLSQHFPLNTRRSAAGASALIPRRGRAVSSAPPFPLTHPSVYGVLSCMRKS